MRQLDAAYVLLGFLEMSCSLELPFCQGPYAKLQLESQRESLAPGSPLWYGIGVSFNVAEMWQGPADYYISKIF